MTRARHVSGTVRFRITAVAALAVLVVLVGSGVALVTAQRRVLTDSVEDGLLDSADQVEALARAGDLPAVLVGLGDDDTVAQVVTGGGEVVAATGNVGDRDTPLADPPPDGRRQTVRTVDDGYSEEGAHRLVSRRLTGAPGLAGASVHVATPMDDVAEAGAALVTSLLIIVPVVVALLAGLVWWLVGRTLRPVEAIRSEVAAIEGGRLDRRVTEPAGDDEIARLARTMNAMLGRVDGATRRQQQFVADASHELRSPLTRIRTAVEVDLAHPAGADPLATHRDVLSETVGLQRLVDDLLRLARHDAGAGAATDGDAAVDLDDLVVRAARRLRADGRVAVDIGGVSAAQIRGDRDALGRALGNLVDNAARYAASSVTFTLGEEGGVAVLTVADDGPGIPPPDRDRVFERFTRADEARHASSGGVGLGLAIVRTIVEQHGGTVELDPGYDAGARFVVRLPAADGGPTSPPAG